MSDRKCKIERSIACASTGAINWLAGDMVLKYLPTDNNRVFWLTLSYGGLVICLCGLAVATTYLCESAYENWLIKQDKEAQ